MSLSLIPRRLNADSPLGRFRDEMERTLETFLGEPIVEPKLFRTQGWMPVVDVSESDDEFTVRAEVPGIPEDQVEVAMIGNSLVISGEKRSDEEQGGADWYRCERRFGSFRRVIDLPATVDPDSAKAGIANGVVTVRVPKRPEVKPRQVPLSLAGTGSKPRGK